MVENSLLALIKDIVLEEGKNAKKIIEEAESPRELLALAEKHQMQHIVAYASMLLGDMSISDKFYTPYAVTKQQMEAADNVSRALNDASIRHMLLKGTVIRGLYPAAWMRNSCDVDILVKPEDHERASNVISGLGYKKSDEKTTPHDTTFEMAEVAIELHHCLIEDYRMRGVSDILKVAFDDALNTDEFKCRLEMSPEMLYFYHVAHTAKHFGNGGCGIRPVLDRYIMSRKMTFDYVKLNSMLERGGLVEFEKRITELSEYWFGSGSNDGLQCMEKYILEGGVYGNSHNGLTVIRERRGKWGYIMFRLFPSIKILSTKYPILKRHKYLLPVMWIVRIFSAPFMKDKHFIAEITHNDTHKMISDLGLSDFS